MRNVIFPYTWNIALSKDHSYKHMFLNGIQHITVEEFAKRTHRKQETIRKLIRKGNCWRRITALKHHGYYLIPESEVYQYPFVEPGTKTTHIRYHRYNRDGSLAILTAKIIDHARAELAAKKVTDSGKEYHP